MWASVYTTGKTLFIYLYQKHESLRLPEQLLPQEFLHHEDSIILWCCEDVLVCLK